MNQKLKSYLLVVLSVLIATFSGPAIKTVQEDMTTINATLWWFLFALIWAIGFLFATKKQRILKRSVKKHWKTLLLFASFNALSTMLWFKSVDTVGVGSTIFLERIQIIFIVILGVILLKEKFNRQEAFGMVIALIGIFLFTYNPTTIFNWDTSYVIISSLLFAFAQLIAKRSAGKIDPFVLVVSRIILIIMLSVVVLSFTEFQVPSKKSFLIMIFAPPLTAIGMFWLIFKSMEHLDMSKVSLVRGIYPVPAGIVAWLLIGETLSLVQVIGGALIMIGVAVMVLARKEK